MAKPIQNTPVLKGKDAQIFLKKFETSIVHERTASETKQKNLELKQMQASYNVLHKISNGAF